MGRSRRLVPRLPRIRRRRSPEVAREELLDAAERVFADHQPDRVGLKEVAAEAGVSHALITHYFGSYAGLIEATLERRVRALRERLLDRLREAGVASAEEMLGLLFRALEDPVHLRLMRWLLASERPAAAHAFVFRDRGLQQVAAQVAQALHPDPPPALVAKLELALLTAVSAAYGYAIGKYALVGALGRQPSRELDDSVQHTLAAMLEAYVRPR
jgi:AcrR family transcriptional regulator